MKKKWLQRIISMVLAVGMLMPSVGAYAEIIDHPTNYKTATSMPMYDNPEIQITEGEYIVEEIVDGSEISSLSNEHKYLVTFAVRDAYQGSFTFIKPTSGILGVDYIEELDHVDVTVETKVTKPEEKIITYHKKTITWEESYTYEKTSGGFYDNVFKGYKDSSVVDRVVTTVVREAYNETRYKYVPEEVVDVPGHFETTRYLYKRGYYKRVSTIDHDGVPMTKMVWVPDEYRSYRSWVKTTYKTVLVKTPYVVHHPEVTSTKTYYKQVPVYEKVWVPVTTTTHHGLRTRSAVVDDKSRPIITIIPEETETVTKETNVYRYAYLYKASKRVVPEVDAQMFENVDIIKSYTQTIKGYKRGGSYYDYASDASVNSSTWIIKDGSRYIRGGQEVDFDPNIYQSTQGKYINETEKRIAESTGIKIFTIDGDTNGISGYIYDNKIYFNDDSPLPSKYVYLKDGSYYNYDGKLIEDFEIEVYQGSNGKYLNSTDRKEQLVSEISGLNKGTVSGNNRLYEIYRDYPEVRDHVVAKGHFYYKDISTGKTKPYEFPKLVGSGHPLSISSETNYEEETKMTYWTSEGQERSGYYRNGKAVTEGLEALSPGDVYYHDEKYYLYGQTPVVISNFNPSIFKDFGGDYKNTNEIFTAIDSKHINDVTDNNWLANFYDQHENFRGLIEEKGPFTYYEESQGTFKEQRPRHIGSENTIRITHKEERDILLAESLEAIQAILDGNPEYINNIAINGTDDILKHNEESLNNKIIVAEIEGVDEIFIGVHEELYGQSTFRCTDNSKRFSDLAKDEDNKGKITYSTYEYYKHKNYDLNQGFASFTFGLFKGTYQGVHDEVEDVAKVAKMATTDFASTAKKVFDFINNMMQFIINLPGNLANINITKEDLNEVADGMRQLTSALSGALDDMDLEDLGKVVGYVIGTIVASNTIGKLNVSLQGGTGPIAKFLKLISFVSETVQKTIQTALTKIMNVVLKPFKAAGQVASNAGSKVLNVLKETGCFVAGTQVLTPDGYKSIEDFEIGDYVYSKNISTNTIEIKRVYQTYVGTKPDIYEIIVDDVVMEATEEHPFWVVSKGWVEAKDLVETDVLIHLDGSESKISSIKVYKTDGTKIYNISVKDNHNYFVTSENILTHNLDCEKFKIVFEATGQMTDDVMDNLYLMVKRGEISDLEMDELLSREMSEVAREQMLKVKRRRLIEGAFDQNGVNTSKLDDILVDLRNNDLDAEELALLREKISQSNNGDLDDILKEVDDVIKGTSNLTALAKSYVDDIVDVAGNVDATKMNDLRFALQKGTFSADEIKQISKHMSNIGTTEAFETAMKNVDFGKYLRTIAGEPPVDMVNPHAHHILFETGLGDAQKAIVQEGQDILRKYGIDPVVGAENLVWAPNGITGQHDFAAIEHVVNQLKAVDAAGGDYDDIIDMLEELGSIASRR